MITYHQFAKTETASKIRNFDKLNHICSLIIVIQSMKTDQNEDQQILVHKTLAKHGFYHLPLFKLLEIQRLLEKPQDREAKSIQNNVITGIIKIVDTLRLPNQSARLNAKQYFNIEGLEAIGPETRDYMTLIITEAIQKALNNKSQESVFANPPLYPVMPLNLPSYPNTLDFANAPAKETSLPMPMHYMNMLNYANQSQMNLTQSYQVYKGDELQQKQPEQPVNVHQDQIEQNQRQMDEEVAPVIQNEAIKEKTLQNDKQEAKVNGTLIYAQYLPDFEIDKSQQEIQLRNYEINPNVEMRPYMIKFNQLKLISKEIQIQTDLSLLNEFIQVFPRKINTNNQQKKAKPIKKKNKYREKIQNHFLVRQEQPKKSEKKIFTEYVLTVNSDYIRDNQFDLSLSPPELKNKSSDFERLERQIRQDIKLRRQAKSLEANLKYCRCQGKVKSNEHFQCLKCNRKYHSSCLKYEVTKDVEECHICQLQSYNGQNQVRETIGIFYAVDVVGEKNELKFTIAQYEYFLCKKIRRHEVELRCCKIVDGNRVDMIWPNSIVILLNDKKTVEIQRVNPKKRREPIVLTDYIIQQNYGNYGNFGKDEEFCHIKIGMDVLPLDRDEISLYTVGIFFIQKVEMYQFIEKNSKNVESYKIDFINKLMSLENSDGQNDLQIQRLVCNIVDPFTRKLIQTPVRGSNCLHIQCFDLKIFLSFMYATKSRIWKCPVCNRQVKKMLIDPQMSKLIKRSIQNKAIPNEVTFLRNEKILLKIITEQENENGEETPSIIKEAKKKYPRVIKEIEKIKKCSPSNLQEQLLPQNKK